MSVTKKYLNIIDEFAKSHYSNIENKKLFDLLEFLNSKNSTRDLDKVREYLHNRAKERSVEIFGNKIYQRGLIEISNICTNDCYYCGIRKSNTDLPHYIMTEKEILDAATSGYNHGIRTFVLQSGELNWSEVGTGMTANSSETKTENITMNDLLCEMRKDPLKHDSVSVSFSSEHSGMNRNNSLSQFPSKIIKALKNKFPDVAITLSLGEAPKEIYKTWFDAGADRYLLRHETATERHYKKLHPQNMKLENRIRCLKDLKDIGYQVGMGFMVGSPGQTIENIVNDINLISELKPQMVGIGPFIPHQKTKFKDKKPGSLEQTIDLLAILRLLFPDLLLPATTALGSINEKGRELGVLAGANVVMPNLTPPKYKENYLLYDGKICLDEDINKCSACINGRLYSIGYEGVIDRGDYKNRQV